GLSDRGALAVAWEGYVSGPRYDVYVQQYDSTGAKAGPEFRVNSYTTSNQAEAALAIDGSGDFILAWASFLQDGSFNGVYAGLFEVPTPTPTVTPTASPTPSPTP